MKIRKEGDGRMSEENKQTGYLNEEKIRWMNG